MGNLKRWIREKQKGMGRGKEGGLGIDGLTDTVEKMERGRRIQERLGWECRGGERRFRSERMYFRHLLQDLDGGKIEDGLSEPTVEGDSGKEALEEMKSQKSEVLSEEASEPVDSNKKNLTQLEPKLSIRKKSSPGLVDLNRTQNHAIRGSWEDRHTSLNSGSE